MLSRVQDPGNAGTILRVADAAGADLVITTKGSVDLYNPKTVRSTAGSLFHVPIILGVQLEDFSRRIGEVSAPADSPHHNHQQPAQQHPETSHPPRNPPAARPE